MKTLELRKASKPLADYTAQLDSESIVITSNQKPVAVLISLKGMDRESVALGLSPVFAKIIRHARAEAKSGKLFSLTEVKKDLLETGAPNKSRIVAARASKSKKNRKVARRGKIRG
jgi:PHD/YefM family antitoxin component YafN of YafNO toxin-antitoxin module